MCCTLKTLVGVLKPERQLDTFHTSASLPGFLTVMRCRLRSTKISTLANAGATRPQRATTMTKGRSRTFNITRNKHVRREASAVLTQFAVRACSAIFDNWPHYHVRLSLSEIKSEHSDGVIRRELVSGECARRLEHPAGPAHRRERTTERPAALSDACASPRHAAIGCAFMTMR